MSKIPPHGCVANCPVCKPAVKDTFDEKASEIVNAYKKHFVNQSWTHLEDEIAQALREAHEDGKAEIKDRHAKQLSENITACCPISWDLGYQSRAAEAKPIEPSEDELK